jgi:hypothetical protein
MSRRNLCRQLGYIHYRLQCKDIAGCLDVCFISKRKAILSMDASGMGTTARTG